MATGIDVHKVLRIDSIETLKSLVLFERAKRAHGDRSQEFVIIVNECEAGLLSYEDWSHQSVGFIYEIFVLPEFRQQSIGAMLLSYAENHALQLDCAYIRLKPYPLDRETDLERLEAWYAKNGYFKMQDEPEVLQKKISTI